MKSALDTSVLVAAFQSWHTAHDAALAAVERVLEEGRPVVPVHVLLETYSVLTRMPGPMRLSPDDAFRLLDETLRDKAEIVDLEGGAGFALLQTLRGARVAGGAVYDALIAAVAHRAGARRLLTLNARHFQRVSPDSLDVVEP